MSDAAPFAAYIGAVRAEWIDTNDHMNLAYYLVLFDGGTDALYATLGLDDAYRARANCGTFAAETHIVYGRELRMGDQVRVTSQVLAVDDKRLHLAHSMARLADGAHAAGQELMMLHVDLAIRRVAPWPPDIRARLDQVARAHSALPRPDWIGRRIAMP